MDQWVNRVKECTEIPDALKFEPSEEVEVKDIGDGYLNLVVRVIGASGKSIVVKQSLPYIKRLGEEYPLGEERIFIEYKALSKFHTLSPGSVPVPYTCDERNHTVFMEDLKDYEILRTNLIDGKFDLTLADKIGHHIAVVHRETHVSKIGEDQIKALDVEFENSNMVNLIEQFIFQRPFVQNDETNKSSPEVAARSDCVYGDENVLTAAKEMLNVFSSKKECLLHGDLHTGSIMCSDTDVRLMDMECSHVGPPAYDLGQLVANLLASHYRHMNIEEESDKHRAFAQLMIDSIKRFVNTYLQQMTASIGDRETYVDNLMSETAGFAACEILRRLLGTAHHQDVEDLPHAEVDILGAAVRLLKGYKRINSIDRLLLVALMLA